MKPELGITGFCPVCTLLILDSWKGWPNKDVIPYLPQVEDGRCAHCSAVSFNSISSRSLTWKNVHGPYNTGLPDYWIIGVGESKWGLPYFTMGKCPKCRSTSIVSQFFYPNGQVEFKHNCQKCGVVAYRSARALSARPPVSPELMQGLVYIHAADTLHRPEYSHQGDRPVAQ